MEPLSINGLVMPAEFPRTDFEAVQTRLNPFQKRNGHGQFIGAWKAISYRYLGLMEYDSNFTVFITEHGPAPSLPLRYNQERDLFGFFASSTSVFDAYCFAMFAIGAILAPNKFSMADERKIDWQFTLNAYRKSFQSDPMLATLERLRDDPAYVELREIRNVLTHRAIPPRHFSLPVGSNRKPTAMLGQLNIDLGTNTTLERRKQVTRLLHTAMEAARTFVDSHC